MKISNLKINKKKILSLMVALGFVLCPTVKADQELVVSRHTNNTTKITQNDESYSFNDSLKDSSIVSQTDSRFDGISYKNSSIRSAGCGPTSITNALALAFNIPDRYISSVLSDVMALDSRYNNIYNYMLRKGSNGRVFYLNTIINKVNGVMVDGGTSAKSVFSAVKRCDLLNSNSYILGTSSLDVDNYQDIINMAYYIYSVNPDTNIIIYNATAGKLSLGRPLGSLGESGHYITILINVKEFVENNSIYVIDSVAKNIKGETNHRVNYNFVENPNMGFDFVFDISRISEQALKLTGKAQLDKEKLSCLGINGGCGIIVCPNNLQKDYNDIIVNNKTK